MECQRSLEGLHGSFAALDIVSTRIMEHCFLGNEDAINPIKFSAKS